MGRSLVGRLDGHGQVDGHFLAAVRVVMIWAVVIAAEIPVLHGMLVVGLDR